MNVPEDAINEGLGNLQQRGIHTSQAGLDPERVERMRHFRDVKGAYFIVKKTITYSVFWLNQLPVCIFLSSIKRMPTIDIFDESESAGNVLRET